MLASPPACEGDCVGARGDLCYTHTCAWYAGAAADHVHGLTYSASESLFLVPSSDRIQRNPSTTRDNRAWWARAPLTNMVCQGQQCMASARELYTHAIQNTTHLFLWLTLVVVHRNRATGLARAPAPLLQTLHLWLHALKRVALHDPCASGRVSPRPNVACIKDAAGQQDTLHLLRVASTRSAHLPEPAQLPLEPHGTGDRCHTGQSQAFHPAAVASS